MGKQILAILSLKYYTAVKMRSVAVTCDKSRWILKTIKKSYFIELQLIYNVVLISAIQQSDSVLYIYMCVCVCVCVYTHTFFFIFFSIMVYELYSSLCYTVGSCSSILYIIVCIHLSQTHSPPLCHLPSTHLGNYSLLYVKDIMLNQRNQTS